MKNFLTNAIDSLSSTTKNITSLYDNHIREKAIEVIGEKLHSFGKKVEDIDATDYEAMVSDASKDIQSDYNKKLAQAGLTVLGLDLLLGA